MEAFMKYFEKEKSISGYSVLPLLQKIKKEVRYLKWSMDDPNFDPLYFLKPWDSKWFEMQYFKWSIDDPYPSEELDPSYSLPFSESEWEERDSQIHELPLSSRCELVYYWIRGSIFSKKISRNPYIYLSGPKVRKSLKRISQVLDK